MFGRKKFGAVPWTKDLGGPRQPQAAQPLKPRPPQETGSSRNAAPPAAPPTAPPAASPAVFASEVTRHRSADIPNLTPANHVPANSRPPAEAAKTLIVGRDISLNGAVSDCDKLVVEGRLEADLTNSRLVEIAKSGVVQGTAVIEEADISGLFEGSLTVRGRLMIRPTGRVFGAIRYGELAIEGGGQIGGEINTLAAASDAAD